MSCSITDGSVITNSQIGLTLPSQIIGTPPTPKDIYNFGHDQSITTRPSSYTVWGVPVYFLTFFILFYLIFLISAIPRVRRHFYFYFHGWGTLSRSLVNGASNYTHIPYIFYKEENIILKIFFICFICVSVMIIIYLIELVNFVDLSKCSAISTIMTMSTSFNNWSSALSSLSTELSKSPIDSYNTNHINTLIDTYGPLNTNSIYNKYLNYIKRLEFFERNFQLNKIHFEHSCVPCINLHTFLKNELLFMTDTSSSTSIGKVMNEIGRISSRNTALDISLIQHSVNFYLSESQQIANWLNYVEKTYLPDQLSRGIDDWLLIGEIFIISIIIILFILLLILLIKRYRGYKNSESQIAPIDHIEELNKITKLGNNDDRNEEFVQQRESAFPGISAVDSIIDNEGDVEIKVENTEESPKNTKSKLNTSYRYFLLSVWSCIGFPLAILLLIISILLADWAIKLRGGVMFSKGLFGISNNHHFEPQYPINHICSEYLSHNHVKIVPNEYEITNSIAKELCTCATKSQWIFSHSDTSPSLLKSQVYDRLNVTDFQIAFFPIPINDFTDFQSDKMSKYTTTFPLSADFLYTSSVFLLIKDSPISNFNDLYATSHASLNTSVQNVANVQSLLDLLKPTFSPNLLILPTWPDDYLNVDSILSLLTNQNETTIELVSTLSNKAHISISKNFHKYNNVTSLLTLPEFINYAIEEIDEYRRIFVNEYNGRVETFINDGILKITNLNKLVEKVGILRSTGINCIGNLENIDQTISYFDNVSLNVYAIEIMLILLSILIFLLFFYVWKYWHLVEVRHQFYSDDKFREDCLNLLNRVKVKQQLGREDVAIPF